MKNSFAKIAAFIVAVTICISMIGFLPASAKSKTLTEVVEFTDSGKEQAYSVPYNSKWSLMSNKDRMLSFTGTCKNYYTGAYMSVPYTATVFISTIPEDSGSEPDDIPSDITSKFSKSKKKAIKAMNKYIAYEDDATTFSVAKDGNGKYMVICNIPASDTDDVAQYHIYRFVDDRHMALYMVGVPADSGKDVPKSVKKLIKAYAKGIKTTDAPTSSGKGNIIKLADDLSLTYGSDWELVVAKTGEAYFEYKGCHIMIDIDSLEHADKKMLEIFNNLGTDKASKDFLDASFLDTLADKDDVDFASDVRQDNSGNAVFSIRVKDGDECIGCLMKLIGNKYSASACVTSTNGDIPEDVLESVATVFSKMNIN